MLERKFTLRGADGDATLVASVSYPEQDGEDYYCLLSVGEPLLLNQKVYGVDPMQAVVLSLLLLRRILSNSSDFCGKEVFWLAPDDDLGLPISK